jgi:hypothetical protein
MFYELRYNVKSAQTLACEMQSLKNYVFNLILKTIVRLFLLRKP